MTPISFGGCFGWLHAASDRARSDVAVLICTPLGYDALPSYGSLRLLADDLAAAGYAALRFDYPGTGDSCDEELEHASGHCAAWCESVHRAAEWLRATTGAHRIVLVGLRGSALLAALVAAARDDVAGLLLLAPVLRGRSYMRQLFVEAKLQSGRETVPGEGLVFREFRFTPATVAQIDNIDLRAVKLRAGQKVALCAQTDSRLITECTQAWTNAGAEVTRLGWAGLEPLLRPNVIEEDTLADFAGVLSWLRQAVPPAVYREDILAAIAPVELRPLGCIETPLRFGAGNRLFGILCRPASGAADTVVLIGNGGRDPRYGAARHAVAFARRLAREGVASLRMDFAGLGDSLGPVGQENRLSPMFLADRTPDIVAALDVLECQGFRRFAMTGLCAGAYHAYVAALADPRLSILLLINMPFLSLPVVSPIDYLNWSEMAPVQFLHRLHRPQSWQKLLERRKEIGGIFRVQVDRLRLRLMSRIKRLTGGLGRATPPSFAQNSFARLAARGVRMLFLFSVDDYGINSIERTFGSPGAHLDRTYPGVAWHVIADMDHDLSYVAGRDVAESMMIDFIARKTAELAGPPLRTSVTTNGTIA